jgi:hypothetical protein
MEGVGGIAMYKAEHVWNPEHCIIALHMDLGRRLPRCAVRDVRPFPVFGVGVGVVNIDAIIDIPKVAIGGTCRWRMDSKFDM